MLSAIKELDAEGIHIGLAHINYLNPSGKVAEPPSVFDYYGLSPLD